MRSAVPKEPPTIAQRFNAGYRTELPKSRRDGRSRFLPGVADICSLRPSIQVASPLCDLGVLCVRLPYLPSSPVVPYQAHNFFLMTGTLAKQAFLPLAFRYSLTRRGA